MDTVIEALDGRWARLALFMATGTATAIIALIQHAN